MSTQSEPLLEQACDWLTKFHSGEFSESDQQRLDTWRATDQAHEQAWQQALALWHVMERLRDRKLPGSELLLQERYQKPPPYHSTQSSYHRHWLAVASSLVLATTLVAFFAPTVWQADYSTGTGEQRAISLADGSQITLNTDSAVAIHYDDSIRRVELLKGEAFFKVAKREHQPFVVTAEGREVRAVGTAFDVQLKPDITQVELVEGIVEIQDPQHRHFQRLLAGQTALVSNNSISVQSNNSSDSMALWRDGYLQFDGIPLRDAIVQINRYRPGKVLLLNNELADKRVSGVFRLDAIDQAVSSLKAAIPELKMTKLTPYWVLLR